MRGRRLAGRLFLGLALVTNAQASDASGNPAVQSSLPPTVFEPPIRPPSIVMPARTDPVECDRADLSPRVTNGQDLEFRFADDDEQYAVRRELKAAGHQGNFRESEPRLLQAPPAQLEARDGAIRGEALVLVRIDKGGRVTEALTRCSTDSRLHAAVEAAARAATFTPARLEDRPLHGVVELLFEFE
jgi:TonB family protein